MKLVITTRVPVSVWHVSAYRMTTETNAMNVMNQIKLYCQDGAIVINDDVGKLIFGLEVRTVANIKVANRVFELKENTPLDIAAVHQELAAHFLASPQMLSGKVILTGEIEEA